MAGHRANTARFLGAVDSPAFHTTAEETRQGTRTLREAIRCVREDANRVRSLLEAGVSSPSGSFRDERVREIEGILHILEDVASSVDTITASLLADPAPTGEPVLEHSSGDPLRADDPMRAVADLLAVPRHRVTYILAEGEGTVQAWEAAGHSGSRSRAMGATWRWFFSILATLDDALQASLAPQQS